MVKSVARGEEWTGLYVPMMFVLILRKIQGYRTISFAVDKLLHFRIGACADFVWGTLRDNVAVSEHNHPRGDAKCTRHVVRDDDRSHVASMSQFER
jgi:hypothetical protein